MTTMDTTAGGADGGDAGAPGHPTRTAMTMGAGPTPTRAYYDGPVRPLLWKLLGYEVLKILTLGIYRFWAITNIRRYLWSNTFVDRDAFEYHGTGLQLFKGFLIALVILAPVLALYQAVQFYLFAETPLAMLLLSLVFFLAIAVLWPVGLYRALAYRVGKTSWRGVRFRLDGSALGYAGRWLGAGLLMLVTLGLCWPMFYTATQNYIVGNLRFGSLSFESRLEAGAVFRETLPLQLLSILAFVLAIVFFGGVDMLLFKLMAFPLMLLPVVFWLIIRVRAVRIHADHVTAGPVRFRSSMRAAPILRGFLLGGGVAFLVVGVYAAVTLPVTTALLNLSGAGSLGGVGGATLALWAVGLFLAALFGNAFFIGWVTTRILATFCDGLSIENLEQLDVEAVRQEEMSYGEGLADALGETGAF